MGTVTAKPKKIDQNLIASIKNCILAPYMIGQEKISEIVDKIVYSYNPERIILFGSYANGTPNEDSDLDLFVVKNTDIPRPERIVQVRKFLWGSMIPIDLIVYTPNEINDSKDNKYSFVYEVLTTGKILYER